MRTATLLFARFLLWISIVLTPAPCAAQVKKAVLRWFLDHGPAVPRDVNNHYPLQPARDYQCFDAHNHLSLKPFSQYIDDTLAFRQVTAPRYRQAVWTLNEAEQQGKGSGHFSNIANYRQSNWQQLSQYRLVCTSLYELERGLAFDGTPAYQENKRTLSELTTGMSAKRYQQIILNEHISPYDELRREYAFLRAQQETHPGSNNRVVLLRSRAGLDSLKHNETGVAISIEGGHALLGNKAATAVLNGEVTAADVDSLKLHIRQLKQWTHPVMFVTLTHLIWNNLAGQGKGTDTDIWLGKKILRYKFASEGFRASVITKPCSGIAGISSYSQDSCANENRLVSYDNGTTCSVKPAPYKLGLVAVTELLSTANGHRILIDLKHSSIKTRLEYYYIVDSLRALGINIPLLVSHSASSGKSLRLALATGVRPLEDDYWEIDQPHEFYDYEFKDDANQELKLAHFGNGVARFPLAKIYRYWRYFANHDSATYIKTTDLPAENALGWFQPASINLADEEYGIICRSNGLIGITIEQRALGGSMFKYRHDKTYGIDAVRNRLKALYKQHSSTIYLPGEMRFSEFSNRFIAATPFMRNLVHAVQATVPTDKIWDHLAIGSDYDGIIDPIDYFHTSERLPELEQFLLDNFSLYCAIYNWNEVQLLGSLTKTQALDKVFSSNGQRFIRDNFPR